MTAPDQNPSHTQLLSRRKAYLVLAVLVLFWGLNWPVMKIAVQLMPPLWFVFARLSLGAALLFLVLVATDKMRWPDRRDLPVIISVGVFQMALYMGLIALGLSYLPAGRSAVLAYTTPLWVVPAAIFLFGEKARPLKLLGIGCGLAGLTCLFGPGQIDWSNSRQLLGNALLLLSAASWAIAILHTRRHRWRLSPLQLAPYQMALPLPLLALWAWLQEGPPTFSWPIELFYILLYNGPLATGFAFWASVSLQRALPSTTISLSYLAVPAWGVVASSLWLGEPITAGLIAGGALILAGVAAMALSDRRGA
jgi:drug/metabolite transporter (DMT)-like permease